jgi:hypothetical protein
MPESAEPTAIPPLTSGIAQAPHREAVSALGWAVAVVTLGLALIIALRYPLAPGLLVAALLTYAALLWRWPFVWLAILPAALPSFDLAPWTGWFTVAEPDLMILVTIGVLALRAPPRRADVFLAGFPGAVLLAALLACIVATARGLALPGPAGGSDIVYLRPDNALRLAKGFVAALALLPFLARAIRERADVLRWLAMGMCAGLALVALAALAERMAFTGAFNFHTGYRIVATFSSMHLGGGYVGLYVAMALPFVFALLLRSRGVVLALLLLVAALALYTLLVTFARAAYIAGILGSAVFALGWIWARRNRAGIGVSLVLPLLLLLLVGGGVLATAHDSEFMAWRLAHVVRDLAAREDNWSEGMALRDRGWGATLFGMGLGTYPRIVLAKKPPGKAQTNFELKHERGFNYLALKAGLPLYFGQKVAIDRFANYRISLSLRSPDGRGALVVVLCEKLLLYSTRCRGASFRPKMSGAWEQVNGLLPAIGLDGRPLFGRLRRPIEFAIFDAFPNTQFDIAALRLEDASGRNILADADFSQGLARWFFTDDNHAIWRIENQYLMSFFETGALGLAAFLLFAGAGLLGACRAIVRGETGAAALAASLAAFLWSSLFDCPLGVPRLAILFTLIAGAGLLLLRAPPADPAR